MTNLKIQKASLLMSNVSNSAPVFDRDAFSSPICLGEDTG